MPGALADQLSRLHQGGAHIREMLDAQGVRLADSAAGPGGHIPGGEVVEGKGGNIAPALLAQAAAQTVAPQTWKALRL